MPSDRRLTILGQTPWVIASRYRARKMEKLEVPPDGELSRQTHMQDLLSFADEWPGTRACK